MSEAYQHRTDPSCIARRPLIMTVQRPIDLPPQLDLAMRQDIRLFESGRIQIQPHIEAQPVGHSMIQPSCGIRAHCLICKHGMADTADRRRL